MLSSYELCTGVKNEIAKRSSAVCTVSQKIKHWIQV